MSAPRSPFDGLDHVDADERPELREPVLIAAFEGWNDAGNAATTAITVLNDQWEAEGFASIDPEEFYDFSSTRPRVEFDDDGDRVIVWPENLFSVARGVATEQGPVDVVTLIGVEPQLKWRTFCEQVTGVAEQLGVKLVVTLGALLAEVPHTRPTSVFGTAYDEDVITELGLMPSRYEGPTGIVGVLHAACRDKGMASASLWGAVPSYISSAPSPKAALALVEKLSGLLGAELDTAELALAARSYEQQVNEVVAGDDDSSEYVARLEADYDADPGVIDYSPSLIDEVEQFLREQD